MCKSVIIIFLLFGLFLCFILLLWNLAQEFPSGLIKFCLVLSYRHHAIYCLCIDQKLLLILFDFTLSGIERTTQYLPLGFPCLFCFPPQRTGSRRGPGGVPGWGTLPATPPERGTTRRTWRRTPARSSAPSGTRRSPGSGTSPSPPCPTSGKQKSVNYNNIRT